MGGAAPSGVRRRWLSSFKLAAASVVGLLAALAAASHAAGAGLVCRTDARQPRDSAGLLIGAAPRELGPEDAYCAVLLVHGYLGCGNNFGQLPEQLAENGFRVRVVLLPGHGTSPTDLAKTTNADLVKAVIDEIDRLRPRHKRVVLVGHSMGGTLCTIAAAQRQVDGLVLAAPYFGVTSHWYYVLKPETWAKITRPIVPWLYKGRRMVQVNKPDARSHIVSYKWVPASSVTNLVGLANQANHEDTLARISCPVLLVHSRHDQAADPKAARQAVEKMKSQDKKTVWVDHSNHILYWDYDAEQAILETVEFCKRQRADRLSLDPVSPATGL